MRFVRSWVWSMPLCTPSSDSCLFFSSFFKASLASRRMLRMITRPSSASLRTTFTSSLRRSSVRVGTASRMTLPSLLGVIPRSDFRMAFSMAGTSEASQGWMVIRRRSGVARLATAFRGVGVP